MTVRHSYMKPADPSLIARQSGDILNSIGISFGRRLEMNVGMINLTGWNRDCTTTLGRVRGRDGKG